MNRYRNFDLEVLGYRRDGEREFLRSRVRDEQRVSEAPETEFPSDMRKRLGQLKRRELDADGLIALGEGLANLLLPPSVRKLFYDNKARLKENEGLRVRIRPDSADVSELPWEYVYVAASNLRAARKGPEGFLALDRRISIVRYEVTGETPPALKPLSRKDLRLVALLAEVDDPAYPPLDLDREELNLRETLEDVAQIEARIVRPGTLGQLEQELSKGAQVFHFAGHGDVKRQMGERLGSVEGQGRLILSGDGSQPGPLPFEAERLARNLGGGGVRLAVLAACESALGDSQDPWNGVATALVREGIPAVIGMQHRLGDVSAIAFGRRFYAALAGGKPIDAAITDGRLAVFNRSGLAERDWGTPVLYLRPDEGRLFPPPPGPFRLNLLLLALSFALLSFWFVLHVFPWVEAVLSQLAQGAGLGAAAVAALLAAWKIAASLFSRWTGASETVALERVLSGTRITWLLGPLAGLAVLLFGGTSSVYLSLEHEVTPPGPVGIGLTTGNGMDFGPHPTLEVTSERPLTGGLIFNVPFRTLAVRVDAPAGWELEPDSTLRPRPWRRAELNFPRDFGESRLRLVRLAPRSGLMSRLAEACPPPDQPCPPAGTTFKLQVTIGARKFPEHPTDLRQGVVYLGAAKPAMIARIEQETSDQRAESLAKCFAFQRRNDDLMDQWLSGAQYIETPEIQETDSLTVEVFENGSSEPFLAKPSPASKFRPGKIDPFCL